MGDWSIVVHGTGAHHNQDFPHDADRMAQRFVDDLIKAGHDVKVAIFTSGGRTVLDTIDNTSSQRLATSKGFDAEIATETARRMEAAGRLGLTPSKRREPMLMNAISEGLDPSQRGVSS